MAKRPELSDVPQPAQAGPTLPGLPPAGILRSTPPSGPAVSPDEIQPNPEGWIPSRDVPVQTQPYWRTVEMVRRALDDMEHGSLARGAFLCDAMGRDDRIHAVLDTRIDGVVGLDRKITCREEQPKDEDTPAKMIRDLVEAQWDDWNNQSELGRALYWGRMMGVGFIELIWKERELAPKVALELATMMARQRRLERQPRYGDNLLLDGRTVLLRSDGSPMPGASLTLPSRLLVPRFKTWHDQFAIWRWDTRSYHMVTMGGLEPVVAGDGHWVVYEPNGQSATQAWAGALVRPLAYPWIYRQYDRQDWARYNERYGGIVTIAQVPARAGEPQKTKFLNALKVFNHEAVIEAQVGADFEYDAKLLEPSSTGFQTFQTAMTELNESIAIVVLGQNLTTSSGRVGSLAQARVHDTVRRDKIKADAMTLGQCIHQQILVPFCKFNTGQPLLAPRFDWEVDPADDLQTKATAQQALAQALGGFKAAAAPVDQRAILEDAQIPTIPEDEMPEEPAPEPGGDAALPGEPTGTPPAKAVATERARMTSLTRAKAARQRIDALVALATADGAEAIRPVVKELLADLAAAADPAALRKKLERLALTAGVRDLEAITAKQLVLAEIMGRAHVHGGK